MPNDIQPLKHDRLDYVPFENGIDREFEEQSNEMQQYEIGLPTLTRSDNGAPRRAQNAISKARLAKKSKYSDIRDDRGILYQMISNEYLNDIRFDLRDGDCVYRFELPRDNEFTYLPVDITQARYFQIGSTTETQPLFIIDSSEGQTTSTKYGWIAIRGIPSAISIHKV
jgi:hypothetical protein